MLPEVVDGIAYPTNILRCGAVFSSASTDQVAPRPAIVMVGAPLVMTATTMTSPGLTAAESANATEDAVVDGPATVLRHAVRSDQDTAGQPAVAAANDTADAGNTNGTPTVTSYGVSNSSPNVTSPPAASVNAHPTIGPQSADGVPNATSAASSDSPAPPVDVDQNDPPDTSTGPT